MWFPREAPVIGIGVERDGLMGVVALRRPARRRFARGPHICGLHV